MKMIRVLGKVGWVLAALFFAATSVQAEVIHKVRPGESLSSIAKKFHVTIQKIREANGLDDSKLVPGQKLSIPEGTSKGENQSAKKRVAGKEPRESSSLDGQDPDTHEVRQGDTLGKIARLYHLSAEELRAINQIKGSQLKVGQVLYLRPMEEGDEEIEGEAQDSEPGKAGEDSISPDEKRGIFSEEKDQQLLVRAAKSFVGAKYRRGGSSVNGMDCSAYVQKVFWILGVDLPRTAREQFQAGIGVAREALRAGDLLFFKRSRARQPTHVAIYIGNDQFIHTSLSKRQVQIDTLESRYFRLRFMGAKRIIDEKNSLTAANVVYN